MPRVVIGNVSTARLPRCNSLLRPRLIGCTFRAYISISRLLFDFLKNGGFRPLHRLTNVNSGTKQNFQKLENGSSPTKSALQP